MADGALVAGDVFREVQVPSWEHARDLSRRLWGWIFRGQEVASWELRTTLDRGPEYGRSERWRLASVERRLLELFERRAFPSLPDAPPLDDPLEWTALLHAHGGPTRLLGCTWSFHVAAFFALERAPGGSTPAAIWAVNPTRLLAAGALALAPTLGAGESPEALLESHAALLRRLLSLARPPRMVCRLEPRRISERLAAQQGLFLAPADLEATFEDNLFGTFGATPAQARAAEPLVYRSASQPDVRWNELAIVKVVVPGELHKHALADLRSMNVTAATLLPGLEGYARSLYYHLGRDDGE